MQVTVVRPVGARVHVGRSARRRRQRRSLDRRRDPSLLCSRSLRCARRGGAELRRRDAGRRPGGWPALACAIHCSEWAGSRVDDHGLLRRTVLLQLQHRPCEDEEPSERTAADAAAAAVALLAIIGRAAEG
eukprot:3299790-Prymnesium_polylepis.2